MSRFSMTVLGCALVLFGCGGEAPVQPPGGGREGTEARAIPVLADRVILQPEARTVEAVGTARARQTAILTPETNGQVEEILFAAGDEIAAGAVLMRLEDRTERLNVDAASVASVNARTILERYEGIGVEGAIPQRTLDDARAARDSTRIELELARDALARRQITAPFSGRIGIPQVDVGAQVTTTTEIARLDDREVLFVDFEVPEAFFDRLQVGDRVPLRAFTGDGATVEGDITAIGSQIDPATRSFQVRASIDNAADRFRPGMSFRANLDLVGQNLPGVPEAAIVWGGDGAYVWAIEDGRAVRVPVTIVSRTEGGRTLVRAPLEDGDLIVAEGVQKVREGAPVRRIGSPDGETAASDSGGGPRGAVSLR